MIVMVILNVEFNIVEGGTYEETKVLMSQFS